MIVYTIGDQPMTCPECGARTSYVDDAVLPLQHHYCLNDSCGFRFAAEEPDSNNDQEVTGC